MLIDKEKIIKSLRFFQTVAHATFVADNEYNIKNTLAGIELIIQNINSGEYDRNASDCIILYEEDEKFEIFKLEDAEYWVTRRSDRGDYEPISGYILGDKLPIEEWISKHTAKQLFRQQQEIERLEKAEYERLKKKFEG